MIENLTCEYIWTRFDLKISFMLGYLVKPKLKARNFILIKLFDEIGPYQSGDSPTCNINILL